MHSLGLIISEPLRRPCQGCSRAAPSFPLSARIVGRDCSSESRLSLLCTYQNTPLDYILCFIFLILSFIQRTGEGSKINPFFVASSLSLVLFYLFPQLINRSGKFPTLFYFFAFFLFLRLRAPNVELSANQ